MYVQISNSYNIIVQCTHTKLLHIYVYLLVNLKINNQTDGKVF